MKHSCLLVSLMIVSGGAAQEMDLEYGTYPVRFRIIKLIDSSRVISNEPDISEQEFRGNRYRPVYPLVWYPLNGEAKQRPTTRQYIAG